MKSKTTTNVVNKRRLQDINEINIAVFICKTSKEPELKKYVSEIGGVVLSSVRGKGLSRSGIATAFGAYSEVNVVFVMCQEEIARDIIQDVSAKFKFNVAGNGKGFLIDTEGYMGAKAAFIE